MPSSSLAFYSFCELIFLCNCAMYMTIMAKKDVNKKSRIARNNLSVSTPIVNFFALSVTCGRKSMTSVAKRM